VSDLEEAARNVAAALASGGIADLSMRVLLADNHSASQTFDARGRVAPMGDSKAAYSALGGVLAALGGRQAGRTFVAEVVTGASGMFEFSYTFDLDELPPRVVLDPDYRLPRHPRPGSADLLDPTEDSRPTDPAVLAEVQSLIATYVERYTALRGRSPAFGPGSSEKAIADVERQLGVRLPDDLRAVYRTIRADRDRGLFGYFCPMSLAEILEFRSEQWPGSRPWTSDLFEPSAVVPETIPAGHVRRVSHSDKWITVASDYGGDYLAVDLDPGPLGRTGQLIMLARHIGSPTGYLAPSTLDILREVVGSLRSQDWSRDASSRLWPLDGSRIGWDTPSHEWGPRVGPAGLAADVAGVADPSLVQSAFVLGVDRARLTDLAPLVNLRSLQIRDERHLAEEIDLTVPADLPLESLIVYARRFDPAQLAGNSTIWNLTLARNVAPIRAPTLRDLPKLIRLDLSGAEVTDIARLIEWPPQVLTLNARQWSVLRAAGFAPSVLRAARLDGPYRVPEAIDWRNWLGAAQPASCGVIRGVI
jgi:cell wall assembly regulator SMI1